MNYLILEEGFIAYKNIILALKYSLSSNSSEKLRITEIILKKLIPEVKKKIPLELQENLPVNINKLEFICKAILEQNYN